MCFLLPCWSKKRRSQRSRVYRLLCTASRTILAKCMEETSRYGILGRYWSWHQRRVDVLSNKIERNYSSRKPSSPLYCIVRAERLRNGEKLYERQYLSPRPPPKISLKPYLNWTRGNDELGSTVEQHPVGKLVQQSLGETLQFGSSKPAQFPKSLKIERGNPLPKRLLVSCKKNFVLPINRGNPIERKTNTSCKITIDRGNKMERKDCTKCKKIIISKIVMMRISSTLQWTTRTLISTSPAFLTKRWNALKIWTFMIWFRES